MPTATIPNLPTDRLLSGQGLLTGGSLVSADGRFTMNFQNNDTLTLVGPQGQPYWTASAGGSEVFEVIMQIDGNLVVYDNNYNAMWASNTSGAPGAILILHDDGNAVISGTDNATLWATKTVVPLTPEEPSPPRNQLLSGQGLMWEQSLGSQNGNYRLVLQSTGNLIQVGPDNQQLWASNTSQNTNIWDAIMEPDGNFVIYNMNGQSLWASDTSGSAGSRLVVEDDGGIVIYDAQNRSIWSVGNVAKSTANLPSNITSSNATSLATTAQDRSSSHDAEIVGGVLAVAVLGLMFWSFYLWLAMRKRGHGEVQGSRRNEILSANLCYERRNSLVRVSVNENERELEIVNRIVEESPAVENATESVGIEKV